MSLQTPGETASDELGILSDSLDNRSDRLICIASEACDSLSDGECPKDEIGQLREAYDELGIIVEALEARCER